MLVKVVSISVLFVSRFLYFRLVLDVAWNIKTLYILYTAIKQKELQKELGAQDKKKT